MPTKRDGRAVRPVPLRPGSARFAVPSRFGGGAGAAETPQMLMELLEVLDRPQPSTSTADKVVNVHHY